MPKSPTKRRPRTVAGLLASALALFTEKGFHATSVSDIVERAGLTRGAFYSNYRDKEELFLALYDAHTDRLLARLEETAAGLDPRADPVAQFLDRIAERPEERRWFVVSMEFTLHAARSPETARALAAHEERLTEGLSRLVLRALSATGRRPSVPAEDLTRLIVALSEGLTALQLIRSTRDGDVRGLSHRLVPHLIEALTEEAPRTTAPPARTPADDSVGGPFQG
ncbi:TetR family transcriptional regulator [Streptomyces sp. Tu 6176]|uniref:TetR/AcrR family transcriptional regulator n=1 Tax=Streptomyces sp. Tu 6176 TaxID=1470557 RepID=UPI00044EADCF|nr:TetR/AcrR family transcriptional regulator [Streptomyces sp. Tu 6176]EYT79587.1 TetR family transcriptional regulator [Streptomyces sp. Tu 6176]